MKKVIRPLTVDQLKRTHPRKSRLKTWNIKIEEMSNGVYKVEAKDIYRRVVSKTGSDPDNLVCDIEREIVGMSTRLNDSYPGRQKYGVGSVWSIEGARSQAETLFLSWRD